MARKCGILRFAGVRFHKDGPVSQLENQGEGTKRRDFTADAIAALIT